MLPAILIVLLAVALAGFTYLRLERLGPRAWAPLAARAVAWSAIGLLILNVSCPVAGHQERPLVLLDGSISMSAPGARWVEARDTARRLGEIRLFGDERAREDTTPVRGRSLLRPTLTAAAASSRPVVVVTDGEIEDAGDLPAELLRRAAVRTFPRRVVADLALASVSGPGRVTAGDSVVLDVEALSVGGARGDSLAVEALAGTKVVARRRIAIDPGSTAKARLGFSSSAVGPGEHALRVRLAGTGDADARTDARVHLITVAPTPGVVLLAAPPDWDSRFLYRTLRDVAQLPVRGFARLDGDQWRSLEDLAPVPTERVRRAARAADLLVLKGDAGPIPEGTSARGVWLWPSGERGPAPVSGDWYLTANELSPIAGAFLGQPVDSFPPATRLAPLEPMPGEWVGLTAQLGRRGAARPAIVGREAGRLRTVAVAADGLWRWAFRGGSSEQSYRTWVASTATWLLGGSDSTRGIAAPVRAAVQNGRPLVFEWTGRGPAVASPVVWEGPGGMRRDTLRFDGAGRASVLLPPGEYRYRFPAGGGGLVAVEEYSDELLPSPVTLASRAANVSRPQGRTAARDWLWLFGLCVLALSTEWLARRRLGLR
jgi:hypothetical protein